MKCKKIWEKYEGDFDNPGFREHLNECGNCKKEYEIELLLQQGVKKVRAKRVPSSIWENIESSLQQEKIPERSFIERIAENVKGIDWSPAIKPAFAVVLIALVSIASYRLFISDDANKKDLARLQVEAIAEIDEAQKLYLNAIEKLTSLAEANRENIEPELLFVYKEKLALIDESIEECKQILQDNKYNINAQKFLFAAYQKKIDALNEMAYYKKG